MATKLCINITLLWQLFRKGLSLSSLVWGDFNKDRRRDVPKAKVDCAAMRQWLHDLRRSVQNRKAQRFFASAQVGLIDGDQALHKYYLVMATVPQRFIA